VQRLQAEGPFLCDEQISAIVFGANGSE